MPDGTARLTGQPDLVAAAGDRAKIDRVANSVGNGRRRGLPDQTGVFGSQHQAPIADEPAAAFPLQSDVVEAAHSETFESRGDANLAFDGQRPAAVCSHEDTRIGPDEFRGQPAWRNLPGERPPGLAAVNGGKRAAGIGPRSFSDGDAFAS
jgi:hypothetical protein